LVGGWVHVLSTTMASYKGLCSWLLQAGGVIATQLVIIVIIIIIHLTFVVHLLRYDLCIP